MRREPGLKTLSVLALGLFLGGCETMEDWFSTKKTLPGERKPVFETGVPGVPQGVPPELVRGYQPPPEPEPQVVEAPPEKPKPRPRPQPRPRQAATPTQPAAEEPLRPAQPAARPATGQPAPWPAPQQQTAQPAPGRSPFPDPPPPGSR